MQILNAFPDNTPAVSVDARVFKHGHANRICCTQMFIEKPISTGTVEDSLQLAKTLVDSKTVVSVGYFLRYLRVVQKMRSIIEDNDLHVMATVARYVCS